MMEINRIHTLLGTAEYYGITIATLRSRMNRRGIRAWAGKLTSEEVEALAERTERPEKVVPVTYRVAVAYGNKCPRCSVRMLRDGAGVPTCVQCGYYEHERDECEHPTPGSSLGPITNEVCL